LDIQSDVEFARILQMSNESPMNKSHPDQNAEEEGNGDNDINLNPLFGSGTRARLARNGIEFFSGIGFYVFGDDCASWGFAYWGFFFHYLCVASGALLVTEHALAFWPLMKIRVWTAYTGLCILLAIFYVNSSLQGPSKPPLDIPSVIPETKPGPLGILGEINAVRPMQQDAIANSFIGAKVRWLLKFDSVSPIGDKTYVNFTDRSDPNILCVVCLAISDDDKNLLRLADRNALFFVSGAISEATPFRLSLSNCKLESYSPDSNTK
jgi:hypothetical protein